MIDKNAEAIYHSNGMSLALRIGMRDLPIEDRLNLLVDLLWDTGTTAALARLPNHDEITAVMADARNEYRSLNKVRE